MVDDVGNGWALGYLSDGLLFHPCFTRRKRLYLLPLDVRIRIRATNISSILHSSLCMIDLVLKVFHMLDKHGPVTTVLDSSLSTPAANTIASRLLISSGQPLLEKGDSEAPAQPDLVK